MNLFLQKAFQKITLLFALIYSTVSIAQIPNWDMESWTTTTKDAPSQWLTFGAITKVTPGQNGSYAIKLQGNSSQDYNNGPGAILYGTPGGGGTNGSDQFFGGTPFTARPDSMIAYFNYNIAAGDSAWVIVSLKNNGVLISNDLYEYTGSYTTGFKRMAFKIHYLSSATPDTMFVGFTSTNPNGNTINTMSWTIIDNISFNGTTQNIPNPDFENWTIQSTYSINGWENSSSSAGAGVMRTTDVYAGSYAMKLQGYTQTSANNNNNGNWGPTFPVTTIPTSLKGFYKYIPQNGDSLDIYIGLWKNGQGVGGGGIYIQSIVNSYTPFSVPINYNNSPPQAPDSATIQIQFRNGNNPRGLSVAYIDNLSFDQYIYSGITTVNSELNNLSLKPNPAQKELSIKFELINNQKISVSIIDLTGSEKMRIDEQNFDIGNHELTIDVTNLSNGVYYLVSKNGSNIYHSKLMIVR